MHIEGERVRLSPNFEFLEVAHALLSEVAGK
jgi:hypothetical protein